MAGEVILVACYYRMSTTKQEDSIDRQRSQVAPYCDSRGYHLVREYVDEGIAGDEILKRREFQRMLRDAQAGQFQAIICDDKDRFGRFDSIDSGEVVAPLRRKGVWLETVAQGRVDWTSFAGRITDAVLQEAKNEESNAISRRVLSSQLLKAKDCVYTGGPAAFGYRWEPDPVRRKRLVPDDRKAEVVKLVFRLYDQGWTLMAIAQELHRRGVPSPKGKPCWTRTVIMRLLTNRRYVGDWTWGVQPQGKRHRFGPGGLDKTAHSKATVRKNPCTTWLICPNAHEPLVDREHFERVQARLRDNRTLTTPHVNGGDFVLNRLMICKRCGSRMCGITSYGKREYVCRGYLAHGTDFCFRHAIPEKLMLRFLINVLQEKYGDPTLFAQLEKEAAAEESRERDEGNLRRLRRQITELKQKIAQGNERLVILPPDRLPGVIEQLRGWDSQLSAIQAELLRIETESPVKRLQQLRDAISDWLWQLREAIDNDDRPLLRQALRDMIDHIELEWTQTKRGAKVFCVFTKGVIYSPGREAPLKLFPSATQSHW